MHILPCSTGCTIPLHVLHCVLISALMPCSSIICVHIEEHIYIHTTCFTEEEYTQTLQTVIMYYVYTQHTQLGQYSWSIVSITLKRPSHIVRLSTQILHNTVREFTRFTSLQSVQGLQAAIRLEPQHVRSQAYFTPYTVNHELQP